jgi:hypothetical protein
MKELRVPVFTEHRQEYEVALRISNDQPGLEIPDSALKDGRSTPLEHVICELLATGE